MRTTPGIPTTHNPYRSSFFSHFITDNPKLTIKRNFIKIDPTVVLILVNSTTTYKNKSHNGNNNNNNNNNTSRRNLAYTHNNNTSRRNLAYTQCSSTRTTAKLKRYNAGGIQGATEPQTKTSQSTTTGYKENNQPQND